ncbi:MAG: hypothetical protein N3C60_02150 [Calditerrivibrio sp.]|nr:hypothetical protein [Calditerrivibrio sp.]
MIRLNLLRFFDKSFSEIYQITHGEIQLQEEEEVLESTEQVESVPTPKKKVSRLLIYSLTGFSVLLIVSASVFGYFYYKMLQLKKEVEKKKQIVEQVNNKKPPVTKPNDNVTSVDNDTAEFAEFKVIGEIVFIDEEKDKKKTVDNISSVRKIDNDTKDKAIDKPYLSSDTKSNYQLVIEDCYPGELDRIKAALKDGKLSYSSKEVERLKMVVYKAYKYTDKSDVYIGNKPVLFLGYFYSKEEAVNFLRENSIKGVITSKQEEVIKYHVTVGSFSKEDEVYSFLAKLGLNNKKVFINKS